MKTLLLCALVAGVCGADNCVDSLPEDTSGYCTQITYEKTIVPGVGVQRITYCPCHEIVEQKIEKLEKRVADLADIEDSIRFLIEAHLAQLEIVTKIEKRVAELEKSIKGVTLEGKMGYEVIPLSAPNTHTLEMELDRSILHHNRNNRNDR